MNKKEMNVPVEIAACDRALNEKVETLRIVMTETEKVLNRSEKKIAMNVKNSTDEQFKKLKSAVKDVNYYQARMYYLSYSHMDVITAGKAIPAIEVNAVQNDNGKYSLKIEYITVYPTMQGMKDVLPDGIMDKIDVLRREIAYLESGNNVFLTGDVENKKDVPSKDVADMLAGVIEKGISKSAVKHTMADVLRILTGDAFKKDVFTALYNDFARYMMKRTGEWGVRGVVSKSTACDMVLEYAYMYFNNMREVKYTL